MMMIDATMAKHLHEERVAEALQMHRFPTPSLSAAIVTALTKLFKPAQPTATEPRKLAPSR
jgi:hypothetical protein